MSKDKHVHLSLEEQQEVETRILVGVTHRAGLVSLIFGLTFPLYGYNSYSFIHNFRPEVTLWDNIWPRILFNGIPFLTIAWFYIRGRNSHPKIKAWAWTILMPVIFVLACLVNVWPILYEGHSQIYLYVHGANAMVLSLTFILVSQPPKQMFATLLVYAVIFYGPIFWMLKKTNDQIIFPLFYNDMALFTFLSLAAAYSSFELRLKLSILDVQKKSNVRKFTGNRVSSAIFDNKMHLLQDREQKAFLLNMDIRGYTKMMQTFSKDVTSRFMDEYHNILSQTFGRRGGFVHKSNGDGHMISFGLYEENTDLSEIPGLELVEELAFNRRNKLLLSNCIAAAEEITLGLHRLKVSHNISTDIKLGIAIDFGTIGMKIHGDGEHRMEHDLYGDVLIRSARLESYTKELGRALNSVNSLIILSPTVLPFLKPEQGFIKLSVLNQIRDFSEIEYIYFKEIITNKLQRVA